MSDNSILDDYSVSSGKRLSTLTVSKSAPQVFVDVHGNSTESVQNIETSYVVPTVKPGIRFLYYIVELVVFMMFSGTVSELIYSEFLDLNHGMVEVLSYVNIFLYYFISEATLGSTIIKELFGYTVINDFAQKITPKEAALNRYLDMFLLKHFPVLGTQAGVGMTNGQKPML